eukprot:Em0016g748a
MIGNMADNFTESTSTHAARAVSSLERSFNWFPVNSGPRLLVISASTATLLNVVLKRTRSTIVDDVVQALEVNPHTKSHCCKHHSPLTSPAVVGSTFMKSSSARQVSSALYFIFYSSSVTQLEAENAKLNDKAKLEEEKAKLEDEKSKLEDEKTKLEAKKAEVENERNSVRNEMDQLEEQMESLKMRTKRLS